MANAILNFHFDFLNPSLKFNMSTLPQKLTLVSHLVKAHVERADKDKDNMVTIDEILAFDDFEFLDTEYLAVSELFFPWISIKYLVCSPGSIT